MAPTTQNNANDEIDDLFDYDIDTEIPDLDVSLDVPGRKNDSSKKVNLGVDEEVKIARTKRPTVRLDAERLLSAQGLPKLRRTAPDQLGKKLKGKGHEYQDAARILNFYQLWADDLYRKANFRDTVSIIEKLGHTKRVQIARNQYLDDYLPKSDVIPPEIEAEMERLEKAKELDNNNNNNDDDDGDLYEPAPKRTNTTNTRVQGEDNGGSLFLGGGDDSDDDHGNAAAFGEQPDDDELDALLRNEATSAIPTSTLTKEKEKPKTVVDEFDDGFEAIDDWDEIMDGAGSSTQPQSQAVVATSTTATKKVEESNEIPPDDFDDEDALEAMYGF